MQKKFLNSKLRSVSYLFKIFKISSSHLQRTSLKSFQFIKIFLQIENYFHIYISNYSLQTWNSLKLRWEECKNFLFIHLISSLFITNLHGDYSMNCIYNSCVCRWAKKTKNSLVENLHLLFRNFFNLSDVSLLRCEEVTREMNNIKMKYLNLQKVI